jgi:hypothetical protein
MALVARGGVRVSRLRQRGPRPLLTEGGMGRALERIGNGLKAASGLALLVGLRFQFGDREQGRKLEEVTIFGLPMYSRVRREARRARRAARKAATAKPDVRPGSEKK